MLYTTPIYSKDPLVDGVEAEWCTLQGKGFSDAVIRTILAAHVIPLKRYIIDGRALLAGVVRGIRIPLAHL